MNKKIVLIIAAILILAGAFLLHLSHNSDTVDSVVNKITEKGHYNTKMEVTSYIHKYHKLQSNYMTKSDAKAIGWKGGSLDKFKQSYTIGGDTFTNQQGVLPREVMNIKNVILILMVKMVEVLKELFSQLMSRIYYTDDYYSTFSEIIF